SIYWLTSPFHAWAASIGGNSFRTTWNDILSPVFAVIYRLVKEFVVAKENQVD
ncbi:permease, partial [Streptococcus sp. GMD2S]